MSVDDPFFVVRDEVSNALQKSRNLYERWSELRDDISCGTKDEYDWTTTELRNGLRSIEWDLEDLEETIGIVENNPKKFKLDEQEIVNRRLFITETQKEVSEMREILFDGKNKSEKRTTMATLINNPALTFGSNVGNVAGAKYSRLQNVSASPTKSPSNNHQENGMGNQLRQQEVIMSEQGNQVEKMQTSVGTLKEISRAMHREIDEQQVMLDGFGQDMELTDSRLDTTLKKVARVLHLKDGNRQWTAIGLLTSVVVILLVGFIIL